MMKVQVRFEMDGKVYRLKDSVKRKIAGVTIGAALLAGVMGSVIGIVNSNVIDETEIRYEKVLIGHDGDASSAYGAIEMLNGMEVDKNDLLPFFEEKNKVESAGSIDAGVYYVPVLKEEK